MVSGLVLIQAFIVFRLWLHLMYSFNDYEWLNIVHLSNAQFATIKFLSAIFISNVVVVVLVPFFIWLVVAVIPFPGSPISMRLNLALRKTVV
jgi:hypothetical protein